MYGTLKKIFAFAGSKKGLLKKSLLFSFLSGLFSAMQFAALFVVIGALVSDNRDGKFICISLGIMAVSLIGRIITTYFSTMEQTETGYCMVAEKRIHIGDRLRYIPMGYFNKNSIGNITAIVTTTLGDVENSAARVLVSVLGGFFNSVALVIVLLVFANRSCGCCRCPDLPCGGGTGASQICRAQRGTPAHTGVPCGVCVGVHSGHGDC